MFIFMFAAFWRNKVEYISNIIDLNSASKVKQMKAGAGSTDDGQVLSRGDYFGEGALDGQVNKSHG